jgi:WD40 repeat protein
MDMRKQIIVASGADDATDATNNSSNSSGLDHWMAPQSGQLRNVNRFSDINITGCSADGAGVGADIDDIVVEMNISQCSIEGGASEPPDGRQLDYLFKPWRIPTGLVDCLYSREYSGLARHRQLNRLIDSSFVRSNSWELKDYLNVPTTISTISIAISKDGAYIATSHGDHTVKVFNFKSAEIFRVLRGHPRTPWTVKFHPLDSNVIASGCLGGEVRIWNIDLGVCTNFVTMDNSIISIAFHPQGSCIAISSGYLLSMWDYRHMMAPAHGGYLAGEDPLNEWKAVRHPRNIRAVMFHPSGEYLFVAAPDHPKSSLASTANILRLYAIPCVILAFEADGDEGMADDTLDLWAMPTVIPEVKSHELHLIAPLLMNSCHVCRCIYTLMVGWMCLKMDSSYSRVRCSVSPLM